MQRIIHLYGGDHAVARLKRRRPLSTLDQLGRATVSILLEVKLVFAFFGQVFELTNGGALDLIVGNYYTPKGRNLNGKGIAPDVPAVDSSRTKRDEALDRALSVLAKRVQGASQGR